MNIVEYYVIDSFDSIINVESFYKDIERKIPILFDGIETIEKIISSKELSYWNKYFASKVSSIRLENNLIRDTKFVVTDINFNEDSECFVISFNGANQITDYYIKKYTKEIDDEIYYREEKVVQFAHENMSTRKICFKKKYIQIFTLDDIKKEN